MHRNTTPQTSCNLFDCVEIHRQRFYFWCCDTCMTSGMRVTPTNAEPGERREVSNISGAISVAGEGCPYHKYLLRIPPKHIVSFVYLVGGAKLQCGVFAMERSVSLGFRTSAAVNCASICDGCCRVFDGRPWSLPKRTEANDMGCDTDRVPLGSTVLAGTSQR